MPGGRRRLIEPRRPIRTRREPLSVVIPSKVPEVPFEHVVDPEIGTFEVEESAAVMAVAMVMASAEEAVVATMVAAQHTRDSIRCDAAEHPLRERAVQHTAAGVPARRVSCFVPSPAEDLV